MSRWPFSAPRAFEQVRDSCPQAIAAYEKALELAPTSPQLCFAMAAAYVVNGETDTAFTWLSKARDQRLDMTRIEIDPDLAPLRRDPRFAVTPI